MEGAFIALSSPWRAALVCADRAEGKPEVAAWIEDVWALITGGSPPSVRAPRGGEGDCETLGDMGLRTMVDGDWVTHIGERMSGRSGKLEIEGDQVGDVMEEVASGLLCIGVDGYTVLFDGKLGIVERVAAVSGNEEVKVTEITDTVRLRCSGS
ncbi:MAG: hypothetical protein ACYCUG_04130 [Acidimicrobiales bacterium]